MASTSTTQPSEAAPAVAAYEPPAIIALGTLADLTRGSHHGLNYDGHLHVCEPTNPLQASGGSYRASCG